MNIGTRDLEPHDSFGRWGFGTMANCPKPFGLMNDPREVVLVETQLPKGKKVSGVDLDTDLGC